MKKFVQVCFFLLVSAVWLAPLLIFRDYLFPYITSKAYPLRVLVELALPFYAYLLLSDRRMWPNLKNPLHLSVILFWVFSFLAGVFGVNPLKSFWGNFERMGGSYYLLHLTLLYFYTVAVGQMGQQWMRRLLYVMLGSAMLATAYGWLVWLKIFQFLPDPTYPRISSTFGNPIFFASFLILPIFSGVFLSLQEDERWKKVLLWVFVALQLIGVYMSGTRGAVIGLVAGSFLGLCAFVYLSESQRVRNWGLGAAAALVVVVGTLFAFNDRIPETNPLWRLTNLKDKNTYARIIQWKTALVGFRERPVLGVGPENYYVVSNEHYNPEMYVYDPSWFDKPHNYQLEILVTTGALGFFAYLGIVAFSVYALYRGFRAELYGPAEFAVLLAGVITYQAQNIFVFDTVPASMMFFATTGFYGYLWYASESRAAQSTRDRAKAASLLPQGALNGVLIGGLVVAVYLVYVTNIFGSRVARAINYGYAYQNANLKTSYRYFEQARANDSNFDPVELGGKYSEVAIGAAINQSGKPDMVQTVRDMIDGAIAANQEAIRRVPNDPTAYQRLASLYVTKAITERAQTLDPQAEWAARKGVELAPGRPEPQLNLVRILSLQNKLEEAESILKQVTETIPTHTEARVRYALALHLREKDGQAAEQFRWAVEGGYRVSGYREVDWLVQYHVKRDEITEALKYLEMAYTAEPTNVTVMWELARNYAKVGEREKAARFANQVAQSDPKQRQAVVDFLKSLQ